MKRLTMIVIIIVTGSMLMADPVDSSILSGPYNTKVEFALDENSYYYEIGFTTSASKPKENVITDVYPIKVSDDGKGHDDGSLYVYWEITGPSFRIELDATDLKADGYPDLPMTVTWENKTENSNEIISSAELYSGKGTEKLSIITNPVTEAEVASYTGSLTLTIRRI